MLTRQPVQIQFQRSQIHIRFYLLTVEVTDAGLVQVVLLRQVEVERLLFRRVLGVVALDGVQAQPFS